MNKIEDLRIGQIVYFENGDELEIMSLSKLSKFPVRLHGNKPGYCGDYTLDAFVIEKPKIKVKREGWINVYPNGFISNRTYNTKEEANRHADSTRVACIKIEWEEEI